MSELHPFGPLAGRIALVTGAARGIGEAIARNLAARDAKIVVADRDGDLAAAVAASLVDEGKEAIAATTIFSSTMQPFLMARLSRR
jgi:NAD(P)-dependent dehydrogenase (short-subunit alcohol dehydrogenase family)